jgi:hypothetical protein
MDKHTIINNVNEKGFTVTYGNEAFKAKIAGAKLDYPIVFFNDKFGKEISTEISWKMAIKLESGEKTNIFY